MALEMAHTDGNVIHTWIFLCHGFLTEYTHHLTTHLEEECLDTDFSSTHGVSGEIKACEQLEYYVEIDSTEYRQRRNPHLQEKSPLIKAESQKRNNVDIKMKVQSYNNEESVME